MKSRTVFLILAAVTLGAVYAYKFTDWFEPKQIQIKYRSLAVGRAATPGGADAITFYLDKEYQLTSLKVISTEEAATNKYPHALWHLVSESNSLPVTDFLYGATLPGMKPKIGGIAPEPLAGNKTYRIFIETKKLKGEKDFETRGKRL